MEIDVRRSLSSLACIVIYVQMSVERKVYWVPVINICSIDINRSYSK